MSDGVKKSIKRYSKNMDHQFWIFFIYLIFCIIVLLWYILSSHETYKITTKPVFQYRLGEFDEPNYPPRLIASFLSPEEVRFLIEESDREGFQISKIEDQKADMSVRQSDTCWLYPQRLPILQAIYDRVLQIPELRTEESTDYIMEPCQIVRYGIGGHYREHYDQCYEKKPYCIQQIRDFNGPRKWTLIMYLTDDFEGGETYFNNLNQHVRARSGDALLFHGLTLDNTRVHPSSLHQGIPISNGEKRIANIWIHYTGVQAEE
jgi:prolyl 4-hydroxylase